jgi:uncharacterized protein (TIGR02171 family)
MINMLFGIDRRRYLKEGHSFKKCRKIGGIVTSVALVISCIPLSPDRIQPVDFTGYGMKKISAAGMFFPQGWNNPQASYDERPGMESRFTYDYWLDSTEVTQKQYYELTKRRPVAAGSQYGVGDDYPVYYVSWFDAVLYCNARSRAEALDTVYVYSGRRQVSGGRVCELTGIRADVSKDGYRLPTESEWEYAARGGLSALPYSAAADSVSACYYAWFSSNSSNKTHTVAARLPNSFGIYDMAGNVFEWTNDWKCLYNGKNISNPLGAHDPGNEYEKVIKGGSYNYSLRYLRPSHRSATYATMLSSANEYVGFRCARGVISNGCYIGIMDSVFTTNQAGIISSAYDLCRSIGTSDLKLVSVNVSGTNRTLCYVDFSRVFPYVAEYLDDRNVYHPAISPDGRYVAYCSRNEGQSGPSKISIRCLDSLNSPIVQLTADTAYIPRWWMHPGTGDTGIVYTNSAVENSSSLWGNTKTYSQKMSGGRPSGDPEELIGTGSYHDGLSVNGRYAVTGFTRLLRHDKVSGADMQLFVPPENGKDVNGSTQVCNVSMSPDTGDSVRCMFLDFGYPRTSTVTLNSYDVHEYLFVSDMSGEIRNFIHCPSGEQSWDGVEWSNRTQFGVGCGRNGANQSHAVYAIDLDGKSSRQLLSGTELQQPYLWVGTILFADSIGLYNDPPFYQAHEATQMLAFWQHYDSIEILITGSSRSCFGVNPQKINGYKTFNISAAGGNLPWEKNTILNYALNQCPHLKMICSSADIGFLGNPAEDLLWEQGFGQSKGYKYDSTHSFWKNGVPADFKNIIKQVSPPVPFPIDISLYSGYLPQACNGWGEIPPPHEGGVPTWTISDSVYRRNLAVIKMIADTLRSRGIHWILVNFPASPHYRGTDFYSFWGPSWQTARDILQQMQDIEASNPFFHLYDANMDGNHDYGDEDAQDQDHLCGTGAAKLSVRIDSIIHTILP